MHPEDCYECCVASSTLFCPEWKLSFQEQLYEMKCSPGPAYLVPPFRLAALDLTDAKLSGCKRVFCLLKDLHEGLEGWVYRALLAPGKSSLLYVYFYSMYEILIHVPPLESCIKVHFFEN